MTDQTSQPPYIYDGLDPVPEPKSAISEVSDAVKGAANGSATPSRTAANPGCR